MKRTFPLSRRAASIAIAALVGSAALPGAIARAEEAPETIRIGSTAPAT